MKVSLNWLKELVDFKLSPKELADKLSLTSIGVKEFNDDYIELDLTYNRGDLLSLRGVAREIAAITGSKLNFDSDLAGREPKTYEVDIPETLVRIEDEKLCPVYCVAKIEELKVASSNPERVKKLADSGVRSINNVADVTNLIMLEYGQPMHAFDARGVKDESIFVRTAKSGERITTLDGKTRDLEKSDLLIADSQNALGIAGVMGGKDCEISETSSTILLEAAIFDPVLIRNTCKRHGLYTEASKRFIHGLTKTNLLQALAAAIKMYESLGGKLTALTFRGDLEDKTKVVPLTSQKINSLIGINILPEQVESSLQSLDFHLKGVSTNSWEVTVPYWRLDINIEEDLIEEVARMYGYEKIPAQELRGGKPRKLDQSLQNQIHQLKVVLKEAGLTEVQTYSFYSTSVLSATSHQLSDLVKVANPISSETQYLRDQLWPNSIEVVARNLKNGFKDIAIFEIGKVFSQPLPSSRALSEPVLSTVEVVEGHGNLPEEKYHLSIALMNGTDNPIAELDSISRGVKLPHTGRVQRGENFHPTRFTETMAEVHPRILNKFGVEKRVAILEVDIDHLT